MQSEALCLPVPLTHDDERSCDPEAKSWAEMNNQRKWWSSSWILSNTASCSPPTLLECSRGVIRGVEGPFREFFSCLSNGKPQCASSPDPSSQSLLSGILGAGESLCHVAQPSVIPFCIVAQQSAGAATCFSLYWGPLWFSVGPEYRRWPRTRKTSSILLSFQELVFCISQTYRIWAVSKPLFQLPQNWRSWVLLLCLHPRNSRWPFQALDKSPWCFPAERILSETQYNLLILIITVAECQSYCISVLCCLQNLKAQKTWPSVGGPGRQRVPPVQGSCSACSQAGCD